MSTSLSEATSVALNNELKVVINGGSLEMESATVPIQFHLSEELIRLQPTHILMIDVQRKRSDGSWFTELDDTCERELFDLRKGVNFVQFNSPGERELLFVPLKLTEKEEKAFIGRVFAPHSRNLYKFNLNLGMLSHDLRALSELWTDQVIGAKPHKMTIQIPEEFFYVKPKKGFAKLNWNWVNWLYDIPPRDECAYRKRMLMAYSIQPFVWLVVKLCSILYRVGTSLWLLSARATVWFFGFRPTHLFAGLKLIWQGRKNEADLSILYCSGTQYASIHGSGTGYKLLTPIELVSLILFMGLSARSLRLMGTETLRGDELIGLVMASIVFALLGLVIAAIVLVRRPSVRKAYTSYTERRKAKTPAPVMPKVEKEVTEKPETFLYFEYLTHNFSLEKTPKRVDTQNPPPAFKKSAVVHRFRVKFWNVKAKICRPIV